MKKIIIFDQPLNEQMRACFRLEHLFNLLNLNISQPDPEASRSAIIAMLEILNVVDRTDIKTKFSKSLAQISIYFSQLSRLPRVDLEKLEILLLEVAELRNALLHLHGKLGQNLHNNEFLNSIRMHMNNPGGACDFSLPAFKLWLEKPFESRYHDLENWRSNITLIEKVTHTLLYNIRACKHFKPYVAENGFFQQSLDANTSGELIRVKINTDNFFPEFSVGKYRMSVRFNMLNGDERPKQATQDIPFEMAYCYL